MRYPTDGEKDFTCIYDGKQLCMTYHIEADGADTVITVFPNNTEDNRVLGVEFICSITICDNAMNVPNMGIAAQNYVIQKIITEENLDKLLSGM